MKPVGRTYRVFDGVFGYKLWGFAFSDGGDTLLLTEFFSGSDQWMPIAFIAFPSSPDKVEEWMEKDLRMVLNSTLNIRYPLNAEPITVAEDNGKELEKAIEARLSDAVQYYEVSEKGTVTKRGFGYVPVDNGNV